MFLRNRFKQSLAIRPLLFSCALLSAILFTGCGGNSISDLIDLIEGPDRRPIDTSRLGINAFANDSRFGSISSQFGEVRDVLGIKYVRILFAWDDGVQPTPNSPRNYSFYDDIARNLPEGVQAMVVMTGVPSWMNDPANWIDGNPRTTFVQRWVRPTARRYRGNNRIIAFQTWNEPNLPENPNNFLMDFVDSPANYVEMQRAASSAIRTQAPGKMVVNGATGPINQSSPNGLDYNRALRDGGMQDVVDVWAIHFYSMNYENVIQSGGVADFLNGVPRPIWISESGERGVNNQLAYVEEVFPFLRERIPGIDVIFFYQFTDSEGPGQTFGLRNPDPGAPVSDLYIHLRERNAS